MLEKHEKHAKPTLPSAWVEMIFKKLTLLYGKQFLAQWEGLDIAEVKADWAEELGRFADSPKALQFALENVSGKWPPPTVREFAEIALGAPRDVKPLPVPDYTPPEKLSPQALAAKEKLRLICQQLTVEGERMRTRTPADRPMVLRQARTQEAA